MAREMITKCDKCGTAGDDVRTYRLNDDGHTVEVDLDEAHAAKVSIAEALKIGRVVDVGIRSTSSTRSLNRRIRGVPPGDGE